MKRYLYLWHRWLGIALCLFMILWLVSGVVMLFVGYPKLTPQEHLAHLPTLSSRGCCISPAAAHAASGHDQPPSGLRLTTVAGEPRYLLDYAGGRRVAIDARSGTRITGIDGKAAMASARQFIPDTSGSYTGLVQEDAWTRSRGLDPERPLHRVQMDDPAGTVLYVSSHSGAVVRDATRLERGWNWLGSWLHWLYLLRDSSSWAQIIIYLSLAATLMAVLGQTIGLLRWRFAKPYRSGSRSPYPLFAARWHHIGGLLFGFILIAWIASGLLSMRPWGAFISSQRLDVSAYQGVGADRTQDTQPLADTLAHLQASGFTTVELHWQLLAGHVYRVAYQRDGESRILPAGPSPTIHLRLSDAQLEHAVQGILPGASAQLEWLDRYDFYYYPRAEQSMYGAYRKRLPILRARFDDANATWLHLDPYSGALVEQVDRWQRLERWLFNLLHSWDWLVLLEHPWLRQALIILASAGGLLVSLSGLVLGWRRLFPRKRRQRSYRPADAQAARGNNR